MKYTEHYEISSHDVDVNNNMQPTFISRYMQETATHQMRDRKPTYQDLFAKGQAFVLIRYSVKIIRQLHRYEKLDVDTWRCSDKGATLVRCYSMGVDGETAAQAYSEWAVVDFINGGFVKPADMDLSNFERDEEVDNGLPKRFVFKKDMKFEPVGAHKVLYADVDLNMHMNNTVYFDILWSYIPDIMHKELTSVNIRYKKEAPIGSEIEIGMLELDPAFAGDDDAEEAWGFKTTVDGKTNVECVFGVKKTESEGMHR